MKIFEIDIGDRVFISSNKKLKFPLVTHYLEDNIYGMLKFLRKKNVYEFTLDGPKKMKKKEIRNIFLKHLERRENENR